MATNINDRSRESPSQKGQCIGFLLLENFTLISLASAIEPLRMANQLAGEELYRWHTISVDGAPLRASDGLMVTPDVSMTQVPELDGVIVCGGVAPQVSVTRDHVLWLQKQARASARMGAICTGSWALARAGLLDGVETSVHWECLASMQEAFPKVELTTRLFSIDQDRFTASGGTAPLDMMLNMIGHDHGRELSVGISEMFIYERMRSEQDMQRVPLKHILGTTQPKLLEIVALMESNLEEPISLAELARYVDVSRRQLERLFQKYLHCSPSRYYLKLRLTRARQLLKQTSLSIIEVASACGFVSTPHFSKCYREYYGTPPRDERIELLSRAHHKPVEVLPDQEPVTLATATFSSAQLALSNAKGEPTYATIRIPR
ncbi:GlxA family transcriptional regulator [Larsenimonas suaedae]|uniref:GlxA family transcriptional regulator n=1 Tax=Larsenimonas suaedae TaxID=1851019 RepID=A0ABU1GR54_9GAMM|nr:GlxA family transcriptional regulator [Larsenimonas suaedae]MCM2972685.1 GlxA family transcriptional regulator [Larsenimonas suaedae]MDR5894518.1 GlxA family transcriptional regulator [Larsenimonas suaedae]